MEDYFFEFKKARVIFFTDDIIDDDLGRGGRQRSTAVRQSRIRQSRERIESDDDDDSGDEEGAIRSRPNSVATSKSVKEYNKAIQNIRGISSLSSQRRERTANTKVKILI